jgi:hypothetical protein
MSERARLSGVFWAAFVLTVILTLTSGILLARVFLDLAGLDAAVVGVAAMLAAMVTAGVAGFQYGSRKRA